MRRVANTFSRGLDAEDTELPEGAVEQGPTPVQAAVAAVDRRLERLLEAGKLICGGDVSGILQGTAVWGGAGGGECNRGVGSGVGATALGVIEWAKQFGFDSTEESEGLLGEALVRHVVRDSDAGLIGTR